MFRRRIFDIMWLLFTPWRMNSNVSSFICGGSAHFVREVILCIWILQYVTMMRRIGVYWKHYFILYAGNGT